MGRFLSFAVGGERIGITTESPASLLAEVAERLRAGQGFAVATLNLDHLVKLRFSAGFRRAYLAQTHVVADGAPIVWLSRLARQPVTLTPGCELVEPMARIAAAEGVPVALFGANPETLEAASLHLRAHAPGLALVAAVAPPYGFDPEGAAADGFIAEIRASGARLCFLALGAPKQEVFAARALAALPGCGFVSIGAGLDFLAGSQVRAPALFRALAIEWVWRLIGNPRRLARRYLDCALLMPGLAIEALRARRSRDGAVALRV